MIRQMVNSFQVDGDATTATTANSAGGPRP